METYTKTISSTIFERINSDTVTMTREQFETLLDSAFKAGAASRINALPVGDTTGRGGLEALSRPNAPSMLHGVNVEPQKFKKSWGFSGYLEVLPEEPVSLVPAQV